MSSLRPFGLATLVLGLGLVLSTAAARYQETLNEARIDTALHEEAEASAEGILRLMDRVSLGLRGARGFLIGSGLDEVTREDYLRYIASRDMPNEFPGILGMGFIRRVAEAEIPRYTADKRRSIDPGFTPHGLSPHGGDRAIIELIEPLSRNRPALGLDVASEPARRAAVVEAIEAQTAVLSAPVKLVQSGPDRSLGILVLLPVARDLARDSYGIAAGPAGLTFAPLQLDELVGRSGAALDRISLDIVDITDPGNPISFALHRPRAGEPAPATLDIPYRNRVWRFEARPLPAMVAALSLNSPALIGLTGAALSFLLATAIALRGQLIFAREQGLTEQARLGSLFDHAHDVIIGTDLAGRVILWNRAATQLFGYTAEESLGRKLAELTVPPNRDEEERALRQSALRREQAIRFDTVRRDRYGQEIDVELSAGPLFDHTGKVIGVAKIIRPIGDRLARMQALQASNATLESLVAERTSDLQRASTDLRGILDALPALIGAWNRDLAPDFVNAALAQALGDGAATVPLPDLFEPDLRDRLLPLLTDVLSGEERVLEHALTLRDRGEVRQFVTRVLPRRLNGEVTGLYLIAHDVTKLQRTRQRLADIIEGTHAGTWDLDLPSQMVEVNARFAQMLGLDPQAVLTLPRMEWRNLLHPEDAAKAAASFDQHVGGQEPSHHVEARMRHAAGHWIWVEITGKVVARDRDGAPRRIAGLCIDISARKLAETSRARSEAMLERTGALARTGGWEVDLVSGEVFWSNETCRIHGLPPGHRPTVEEALAFYPEPARLTLRDLTTRASTQGEGWDIELPFVRADGVPLWIRTVAEVQKVDGRPVRLVGAFLDLTAQHAVQNALYRQIDLTRNMIEASPVAMYFAVGEGSVIAMANADFCRLVGRPRAEVLGRPLAELIDSAGALQRAHGEAASDRPTRPALIRTVTEGRADTWVMASHMLAAMEGSSGVLGWLYDVTELREAREGAQRAQELLLQALSVTRTGLAIFDASERLEMMNDRFGDLFRRAEPKLRPGASFTEVLDAIADAYGTPPGVQRTDWLLDRLLDLHHGGEHVWQTDDDRYIHAVERKLSDGRTVSLRSDISELMRAREQAEAASRAKSAFISSTSHEIRTPLHAILGLAYLLEREHLPEVAEDLVRRIAHAGKTLLGLVNNVLDLAKIEAQQVELDLQDFDLGQLVEEEFGLHAAPGLTSVATRLELAPDLPQTVNGDPGRLRQVLNNLLGNALKFTAEGEVVLQVLTVGDQIRFEVRDTGVGIAPELQDRIFRPFEQADASITRRFGGTGLGLAISAELVALMGGTISCDSAPGRGSTFTVDLPLLLRRGERPFDAGSEHLLRVLLAEEGEGTAGLIRSLGWSCATVADGRALIEAATLAQDRGQPFDALILGAAFRPALAELESRRPDILWPAVVIADRAEAERLRDDPALTVLPRPIGASALFNAVNASLSDLPTRASRLLSSSMQKAELMWLSGVRILVIDDNPLNLDLARKILELEGAEIVTCEGGVAALEILAREGQSFDAVLLDVQMPEIDGNEVVRRLRRLPQLARLPVIALSAGVLREERRQALEAGMNDFLPKPLEPVRMITALRRHVERRRGAPVAVQARSASLSMTRLDLPGIDESAIARHLLQDRALLISMLRRFVEGPAVDRLPGPALPAQLHRLRGAAAAVGAVQVALTARAIEEALAAGEEARAERQLALLHEQMETLQTAAAPLFAAEDRMRAARDAALGPADPLTEEARKALIDLLAAGNARALGAVEDSAAAIRARYGAERLADLRSSLTVFDFPRAAALLAQ